MELGPRESMVKCRKQILNQLKQKQRQFPMTNYKKERKKETKIHKKGNKNDKKKRKIYMESKKKCMIA